MAVQVEKTGDNKYTILYSPKRYRDVIGRVSFVVEKDGPGQFDITGITVGKLEKQIAGTYNVENIAHADVMTEAVLMAQSSESNTFGDQGEMWENIEVAMGLIRGEDVGTDNALIINDVSRVQLLSKESKELLEEEQLLNKIYYLIKYAKEEPFVRGYDTIPLCFLVFLSAKFWEPLSMDLSGPSGSGKSYAAIRARLGFHAGFKSGMATTLNDVSAKALKYMAQYYEDTDTYATDLWGKSFLILERTAAEDFLLHVKPLMSQDDDEISNFTAEAGEDGKYKTTERKYVGFPSYIILGTYQPTLTEEKTRTINKQMKSSKEKDIEIGNAQIDYWGDMSIWKQSDTIMNLRDAMGWLKNRNRVRNPFNNYTRFIQKDNTRIYKKMRAFVGTLSILHQLRRPKIVLPEGTIILSSFEDIILGLSLYDDIYQYDIMKIPEVNYQVLKALFKLAKNNKSNKFDTEYLWTMFKAQEKTSEFDTNIPKFSTKDDLKEALKQLNNTGHVIKSKMGRLEVWEAVAEYKEDLDKEVSLPKLFTENVLNKLGSVKEEIKALETKYKDYIVYPDNFTPSGKSSSKLYDYLMHKEYFKSDTKTYKGGISPVHQFISCGLKDILYQDSYKEIGLEETLKKKKLEQGHIKHAKQLLFDNWEQFAEYDEDNQLAEYKEHEESQLNAEPSFYIGDEDNEVAEAEERERCLREGEDIVSVQKRRAKSAKR